MLTSKLQWTAWTLLAAIASFAAGCGRADNANSQADGNPANSSAVTQTVDRHDHEEEGGGHSLHGWWCVEHGVPEEECTRCDSSLIAMFKEKGDWCEMHDLPDSQCFICHPENEAKFIARYEAKFGEKPPKRTE